MRAVAAAGTHSDLDHVRVFLHERLRARRREIELALLNRMYGISDTSGLPDPEYLDGLRAAVAGALDYGLAGIERGDERAPPVPAVLLVQARTAARIGIGLDTVLRRYFAGYALLGDFLLEEAEKGGLLDGPATKSLLRTQAALLDRLLAEVSKEHAREAETKQNSAGKRRAERVQRLLAGELLDTAGIDYDFGGHHLGAIAIGERAGEALRELPDRFDCRLLQVRPAADGPIWAWLGARRKLDPADLERISGDLWPNEVRLAVGELGRGLAGWRITHQQARAALPIVLRGWKSTVRYSEVALLASMLQDDLLLTSLRQLYLAPLDAEREGGTPLRETLAAYFAAGRNVSSAAAALGVSRRTVANRLRAVESRLGQPLEPAMPALEAALQLDELTRGAHTG